MEQGAVGEQKVTGEALIAFSDVVASLRLSGEDASEIGTRLGEHEGQLPLSIASRVCFRYSNSYTRMPFIFAVRPLMASEDWWVLLGQEWSGCDNIAMFSPALRALMKAASQAELERMMPLKALTVRECPPRTITVYRGCYECNKDGLSWSTSRRVAASFPYLHRYYRTGEQAFLLTGTVDRTRAVLLLDRSEDEVVSADVTVTRTEKMRVGEAQDEAH